MKICIYGGAFDPIHLGHLYIADRVYEELHMDTMLFVPAGIPPWKKANFAMEDRVKMLSIAIGDNPRFGMELFEVENKGSVSYSCDTVRYLSNKYPEADIFFLVGSDALSGLDKWKDTDYLAQKVTFIAVERNGHAISDESLDDMRSRYKLVYLKLPYLDISSTYIREAIEKGISYRYMLRDDVYEYIQGIQ